MNAEMHEIYMQRCLHLASLALGHTHPNPMVGAVVVHNNRIIGEGFHQQFGQAHAEVNAIAQLENQDLLKESTLYVSLEPCCHHGKTPPCTSLIIEKRIPNVVVAAKDPNPLVAGKGIQILKKAGVRVTSGILEKQAKQLNKRFNTFFEKQRPYIILKWAQSKDGYIDVMRRNTSPHIFWISNAYSKQIVHQWRAQEAGILIGCNTAINDNPKLTTRLWHGNNPTRIVIDPQLRTPPHFSVFSQAAPTLLIHDKKTIPNTHYPENIQLKPIDFTHNSLPQILKILYNSKIVSVIIEGGLFTLQEFIRFNCWDEARVILGNKHLYNGIQAPQLLKQPIINKRIIDDTILFYHNQTT
jgi:diaminohydroxyphosphoribosylaminopyrimidine deaminase / 5-amino-6-(5-phosphoribosylamino)uracil reductase